MNKIRSFGSTIACQNDVDYMIKDLVKYEFIMLEWHVKEHKSITKKWQQANTHFVKENCKAEDFAAYSTLHNKWKARVAKSFRMDSHSDIAWTSRTSSHVSYSQTKLMLIDVIWCR